jgi:hypothetical protein
MDAEAGIHHRSRHIRADEEAYGVLLQQRRHPSLTLLGTWPATGTPSSLARVTIAEYVSGVRAS